MLMLPSVARPRRLRIRDLAIPALVLGLAVAAPAGVLAVVPPHDHVAVVIMENHSYDETRVLSYTASLIAGGGVYTQSYAITHPSQPNYFTLWSASTQGLASDVCPPTGQPYGNENLGHACQVAGKTWRAYSENLPNVGSALCQFGVGNLYTRKHDPWVSCSNVSHVNERPYTDLATDIANHTLPNLVFVVPNNCDNTHDCSLTTGDGWLGANLPAILGALGPTGLLILTWDEDDNGAGNHILTVFSGPLVIPGSSSSRTVTHYTVVRTICAALGLPAFGNASSETPMDEVFFQPTAAYTSSWGRLKMLYR